MELIDLIVIIIKKDVSMEGKMIGADGARHLT